MSRVLPRPPRSRRQPRMKRRGQSRAVWMLQGRQAGRGLSVTTGATDGKLTEIVKGEIARAITVITGSQQGDK